MTDVQETSQDERVPAQERLTAPITVALSRDELLVVLGALGVETVPGIDVEPTGDWTEREKGIARMVAVRSLRARGLVQLDANREPQFHTDLLRAVGASAHSQGALFLFHWPQRESAPIRTFGHVCGDDYVLHARPDDELHFFTLIPTKDAFLTQVLTLCGVALEETKDAADSNFASAKSHEFRLPSARFAAVRGATSHEQARQLLLKEGVAVETAEAFASSLVTAGTSTQDDTQTPSRISILQSIQQTDDNTVLKRDFTILEDAERCWLIAAESSFDEALPLLIKSTTRAELHQLLDEWV